MRVLRFFCAVWIVLKTVTNGARGHSATLVATTTRASGLGFLRARLQFLLRARGYFSDIRLFPFKVEFSLLIDLITTRSPRISYNLYNKDDLVSVTFNPGDQSWGV